MNVSDWIGVLVLLGWTAALLGLLEGFWPGSRRAGGVSWWGRWGLPLGLGGVALLVTCLFGQINGWLLFLLGPVHAGFLAACANWRQVSRRMTGDSVDQVLVTPRGAELLLEHCHSMARENTTILFLGHAAGCTLVWYFAWGSLPPALGLQFSMAVYLINLPLVAFVGHIGLIAATRRVDPLGAGRRILRDYGALFGAVAFIAVTFAVCAILIWLLQ